MSAQEPTTLNLSERAHQLLSQMKDDEHFSEMADGYRLGIALALAQGVDPPDLAMPKKTLFNVGTLDPQQEIATAIRALTDLQGTSVYRMAERLADWGVRELADRAKSGSLDIPAMIGRADAGSSLKA